MDTKDKKGTTPKRTQAGAKSGAAGKADAHKRTAPVQTRRRKPAAQPKKTAAPTPDVVYTPAQPFSRGRFLLRLATVVAVVVAIIFGISIFFKVDKVTVSGADKYTPYMIQEASGIKNGDNLLTLDKVRSSSRIIASLPYVESVRIGIQLPDTVHIEITEMDVVYSIKDSTDAWWLINSDGRVVVKADNATAGDCTQILGVKLENPVSGQQAKAAAQDAQVALPEQAGHTLSGDLQLATALSIVQYLEDNSIIGKVASVDVTDLSDIQMWYGQQYQVLLGDTTELGYKIRSMQSAIAELEDYQNGILDVSFTIYPDQVRLKKFP